jgi:signal transduction histidine kinase
MRERMRQLGGSLTVRTSPLGTCVQAKLPLARASGAPIGQRISL